jgi:LacI family transcriptional regulator
MAVRLLDIAREAGVSRVLAGKILLGGKSSNIRFSSDTEEKVRLAASKLGYSPNHAARQLRGVRSKTIGVLMPVIESNILFAKLRNFVCHASGQGYGVLVRDMPETDDELLGVFKDFASRQSEGVLAFDSLSPGFSKTREYLENSGLRTLFHRSAMGVGGIFKVDLANGVEQAVVHLLERGYKRVGVFLHNLKEPSMIERLDGYKSGLKKSEMEFDERLVWSADIRENISDADPRFPAGVKTAASILIGKHGADALIMSNDIWALHMSKHLAEIGISIPAQVGLVGCDNTSASFLCSPELTTIDQKINTQMSALLDFFLNREDVRVDECEFCVKPELIIRKSTMKS